MPSIVHISPVGEKKIELARSNTIGRHHSNRIQIPDISVSKKHAAISINRYNKCMLSDLSSTNGTFVNNKKVKSITLFNGDEIKIGNVLFHFIGDQKHAAQMVKIGNDDEGLFQSTMSPKAEGHFSPEKEIMSEKALRADYKKLRVTYELQRDISLEQDITKNLDLILSRTYEFLQYDQGVILLSDNKGQLAAHSYKTREGVNNITISSTLVKYVKKKKTGVISTNIELDNRFSGAESIIAEGVKSTIAVPIINNNDLLGMMILYSLKSTNAFTEKDLSLITVIANQTAQIIKNSLLHEELRLSFESSIRTLSATVDAKHPLTAGHSERVTELSLMIAEEMALKEDKMEALEFAALMHDIGKIGIEDKILLKDGRFTDEERKIMDTHPVKTREILENFHFPDHMQDIPLIASSHHEMVNGKGYPLGLKGDEIPVEARIMAVADVFEALTYKRDYPKYSENGTAGYEPFPLPEVIKIIKKQVNTKYDENVVEALLKCLPKIISRFSFLKPLEEEDISSEV